MTKYCFNYGVEGVYSIAPMFKCACAKNKSEAFVKVREHLVKNNAPKKVEVYPLPYSPLRTNPRNDKYLDDIQTIKDTCMDTYSQALGYGIFCGKRCAERKIAAGIPPLGARKLRKGEEVSQDTILAQAALEKSRQQQVTWSPTQVAAVVGASLLGIALMVVIIKRSKKQA